MESIWSWGWRTRRSCLCMLQGLASRVKMAAEETKSGEPRSMASFGSTVFCSAMHSHDMIQQGVLARSWSIGHHYLRSVGCQVETVKRRGAGREQATSHDCDLRRDGSSDSKLPACVSLVTLLHMPPPFCPTPLDTHLASPLVHSPYFHSCTIVSTSLCFPLHGRLLSPCCTMLCIRLVEA